MMSETDTGNTCVNVLDGLSVDRIDIFAVDEQAGVDGDGALVEGGVELVGKRRRHVLDVSCRTGKDR